MKNTTKIYAFHLLNDRSGSPKVLSQILKNWCKQDLEVHLYTTLHQDGFLSNIEGVHYHKGWYRFKANPWLRLLYFSLSQFFLFFKMFRQVKKEDVIYINTVLPFGAAILAKIKGCRVIYHIHESTLNPPILKWFLFSIVQWSASDIINVSKYVEQSHGITTCPNHLVYNAINEDFLSEILPKKNCKNPENVMMVCSLKTYKGVFEFVNLAEDHPQYSFRLVLNAKQAAITSFFEGTKIPTNLVLYASQQNLHPFYQWADVVVNLSRPDGWIETFGLTIIEGMAYGLPAIVPPVGGVLEVIEEGVTGFSVDSRQRKELNSKLTELMVKTHCYKEFSEASKKRIFVFKEKLMLQKINTIIL